MTLQNSVLLVDEVPSTNLRDVVVDNGVETSLAPIILVLDDRSRIYLCRDKKKPRFCRNNFHSQEKVELSHVL